MQGGLHQCIVVRDLIRARTPTPLSLHEVELFIVALIGAAHQQQPCGKDEGAVLLCVRLIEYANDILPLLPSPVALGEVIQLLGGKGGRERRPVPPRDARQPLRKEGILRLDHEDGDGELIEHAEVFDLLSVELLPDLRERIVFDIVGRARRALSIRTLVKARGQRRLLPAVPAALVLIVLMCRVERVEFFDDREQLLVRAGENIL